MQIFNNTTVVGLFDTDKEVEQAVTQLQENGFGQDSDTLQIIDNNRLAQETPVNAPGPEVPVQMDKRIAGGNPASIYNPITGSGTEASHLERSTHQALTDKGLGDEEASFYARQVVRGNALVIIEADEERAAEAAAIMEEVGAKTFKT